jgi:hypothetical protein
MNHIQKGSTDMKKDYKKMMRDVYSPAAFKPAILTVPALNYLMVSGYGHPGDDSFQMAAQTLFPVAYVSKFILKAKAPEEDYTVMPMEVKWRLERKAHGSNRYSWTMMIMQPTCIDESILSEAIHTLKQKNKSLPYEERIRLGSWNEGLCGQILHVGPYEVPMEDTFDFLSLNFPNAAMNGSRTLMIYIITIPGELLRKS